MANPETRVIDSATATLDRKRIIEITQPRVYTKEQVKDGKLTVELAGKFFDLKVKNKNGVDLVWLNPDGEEYPGIKEACSLEVGFRLAKRMGYGTEKTVPAVTLVVYSEKSMPMAHDAGEIAAALTGQDVLEIKIGGDFIDNVGKYLDKDTSELLSWGKLKNGDISNSVKGKTIDGQVVRAIRYKPITGKDKFMFITEDQFVDIKEWLKSGIFTIDEDVASMETTIRAARRLAEDEDISQPLRAIVVAREGEWSDKLLVDYAIQIPLL